MFLKNVLLRKTVHRIKLILLGIHVLMIKKILLNKISYFIFIRCSTKVPSKLKALS